MERSARSIPLSTAATSRVWRTLASAEHSGHSPSRSMNSHADETEGSGGDMRLSSHRRTCIWCRRSVLSVRSQSSSSASATVLQRDEDAFATAFILIALSPSSALTAQTPTPCGGHLYEGASNPGGTAATPSSKRHSASHGLLQSHSALTLACRSCRSVDGSTRSILSPSSPSGSNLMRSQHGNGARSPLVLSGDQC